jgi:hypothetical protein
VASTALASTIYFILPTSTPELMVKTKISSSKSAKRFGKFSANNSKKSWTPVAEVGAYLAQNFQIKPTAREGTSRGRQEIIRPVAKLSSRLQTDLIPAHHEPIRPVRTKKVHRCIRGLQQKPH